MRVLNLLHTIGMELSDWCELIGKIENITPSHCSFYMTKILTSKIFLVHIPNNC